MFYSTNCATVNTMPFNWHFEGSVLGEGMCLNCLVSTKEKKIAANTSSNDVVVTQNNTHHISNSQNTAKRHGRGSHDICPKNTF